MKISSNLSKNASAKSSTAILTFPIFKRFILKKKKKHYIFIHNSACESIASLTPAYFVSRRFFLYRIYKYNQSYFNSIDIFVLYHKKCDPEEKIKKVIELKIS